MEGQTLTRADERRRVIDHPYEPASRTPDIPNAVAYINLGHCRYSVERLTEVLSRMPRDSYIEMHYPWLVVISGGGR